MSTFSKTILTFALLWGLTLFTSAQAQTISLIQSGAECRAANLGQALNLGMGSSQLGVKNNGNAPFFVVCPITMPGVDIGGGGMIGRVAAAGETIACTARFKVFNSAADSYFSESVSLITTPKDASPIIVSGGFDIEIPGVFVHNGTIVCALGPGQIIESYGFSGQAGVPE